MIEDILTATLHSNSTGTRSIRAAAGVGASKLGDIAPETVFTGIKRLTAESALDFGVNSKPGDKWWYCENVSIKQGGKASGWVAERHAGQDLLVVAIEGGEDPPPPVLFPESFTLTDSAGNQALYQFVRVIE